MAAPIRCCFLRQTLTTTPRQKHFLQICRHLKAINGDEEFEQKYDKDGFREFDLYQVQRRYFERKTKAGAVESKKAEIKNLNLEPATPNPKLQPVSSRMTTDQSWPDAWPTAKMFTWSQVPFDVRQGFATNRKYIPTKRGSFELMKIPNFLHLTPPHIRNHCQALKELCTEWPEDLKTEEDCKTYFPIEVITADYVFSGPSIRDPRARKCIVKFDLDDLELDDHARDKFIRLVEERYDKETNMVTFVVDRCPTKKQNLDFAMYLLTAVYFESWTVEDWEEEQELTDWSSYHWDLSPSRKSVLPLVKQIKQIDEASVAKSVEDTSEQAVEEAIVQSEEIKEYKKAVSELFDQGENIDTLTNYKQSVLNLFNLAKDSKSVSFVLKKK